MSHPTVLCRHTRRDNAVLLCKEKMLLWMMLDTATRETGCWGPVVTIESVDFTRRLPLAWLMLVEAIYSTRIHLFLSRPRVHR